MIKKSIFRALVFLCLALFGAQSASAAIAEFTFDGTINRAEGANIGLRNGDKFTGSFSWNDALAASRVYGNGTVALYDTGSITALVKGHSFAAAQSAQLQILNNVPAQSGALRDDVFLSVRQADANGSGFWLLQIDMPDMSGKTLNSLAVPTAEVVAAMNRQNGRFWVRRFASESSELGFVEGHLHVSSVPEPGTWGMLMAGLVLMSALTWRRPR
ncbi:hypothetical protein CSQ96_24370 [Janthinobacterium sp. BJB412]|nr:hypothetical protein CSQ96_24370 [Janthinobacterium sp. BJB412]